MKRPILSTLLLSTMAAATPLHAQMNLERSQDWYHSSRANLEQSYQNCSSTNQNSFLNMVGNYLRGDEFIFYPSPRWEEEIKRESDQCLDRVLEHLRDHSFAHSESQVALREEIIPQMQRCIEGLGNNNIHREAMDLQQRQYRMTFFVPIRPEVTEYMRNSGNPYCQKVVELSENSPIVRLVN